MMRVESHTKLEGFTEFEEDILFDDDDPDFDHEHPTPLHSILFRSEKNVLFHETRITLKATSSVTSNMSLATSVHPAELRSSHSSLTTLSHSLDDITGDCWSPPMHSEHVLTIEELRNQMHCCFTCGVSWADSHVSLDCSECGGYALQRPCIACDGGCGVTWKRDLSMSHASGKAKWVGECARAPQQLTSAQKKDVASQDDLSKRLERLSANS